MRILQVVNDMHRAGLETMLMNYYRNIDRTKIQFDFLTHRPYKSDYDDEILSLGGRMYYAPRLYPQNYIQYFRWMDKFFEEHLEYQIMHSHIDSMSYLPLLAAKRANVPVRIAHSHNTSIDRDLKYPLKQLFRTRITKVANEYCACGEEAGKFLFGNRDFKVIPNAIETERFIYKEEVRKRVRKELHFTDEFVVGHEVVDLVFFQAEMKESFSEGKDKNAFAKFLNLLQNTDYTLTYYDKNLNRIDAGFKLSNLMELQCIKANHLKNDHCLTDAFNKIINYRYDHVFQKEKREITKELEQINSNLTQNISKNHTDIIRNVLKTLVSMECMGVDLSADITFDKLMKDLIKYEYIEDETNIPEDQFGLGYTNLVMIIATIMDYMERYPDSSFNSKINLISIEEPETFMHPQMQELFIKNINEAIRVLLSSKDKDVNSQIIITTHSSHILNSKIHSTNTFNNICYLHEEKRNASVANLCNKIVMPNESENEESESFKFLKKHIKYKVSELFFSEAAIFVEGFSEDMIIPYYIEKRKGLSKYFISIFNINGAHGFLYKRLIEALGIPVLIITDLDIKRKEESEEGTEEDRKSATIYQQISCLDDCKTTNATIIDLYGKADISDIPNHIEKNNLYLGYQGEINGYYATSFEEAFILTNYDNALTNELLKELKPQIYKSIVGKNPKYEKNKENSYK